MGTLFFNCFIKSNKRTVLYKYINYTQSIIRRGLKNIHQDKNIDINKLGAAASKYKYFEDNSKVTVAQEETNFSHSMLDQNQQSWCQNEFEDLELKHGTKGVFEIEDLVKLLIRENAVNIFVSRVPPDIKYVDYIIVVSGKSRRHMLAIAEFIRKAFKRVMFLHELVPKIEGKNSSDWIALDLGNIALHIFSPKARVFYDIDTLWAVGCEYDSEVNKVTDPITEILEKQSHYLRDLEPASQS